MYSVSTYTMYMHTRTLLDFNPFRRANSWDTEKSITNPPKDCEYGQHPQCGTTIINVVQEDLEPAVRTEQKEGEPSQFSMTTTEL